MRGLKLEFGVASGSWQSVHWEAVLLSEIRWHQRLENFQKAFLQLQEFAAKPELNKFEKQGLIQCFEYTFELAWKTLKDYLESEG